MVPQQAPDARAEQGPRTGWMRARPMVGVITLAMILVSFALIKQRGWFPRAPSVTSPPPPVSSLLGKGRTFLDALLAQGIQRDLALGIVQAFRPHVDFRRLQPSGTLEFHQDTAGALTRIVYRQSPVDIVEAWRDREAWTAARRDVPVERNVVLVAGTVAGSLFESMEALGKQAQLVLDFAGIFAWDFDFTSDSQPGDRFRMLVEKVYAGDQF